MEAAKAQNWAVEPQGGIKADWTFSFMMSKSWTKTSANFHKNIT
jgi:hypothetical protein